jgi:hypothetical protein
MTLRSFGSIAAALIIAAATCLTSCTLPQRDESGQRRVTEQEIQEITPLIHKRTYRTGETIAGFRREPDGAIDVQTENTVYVVRKVNGNWKIIDTGGIER